MAVQDLSFELKSGEAIAIVGSSWCWKSTLLKILAWIISKKNGHYSWTAKINGINIFEDKNIFETNKGKIGMMFQDPSLLPHLTVEENIKFPLEILKKKLKKNDIENILEKIDMTKYKEYLPAQLSWGMKTRVALARTFICQPSLLLLDEPFASLDIDRRVKIYDEVLSLKKDTGTTIILVTHNIQEALFFANTIIVITKHKKNHTITIEEPLPRKNFNESMKKLQKELFYIQDLLIWWKT